MQNFVKDEYARTNIMNNNTEFMYIAAPLASQEEFASDSLPRTICSLEDTDTSKVPLDICPIVKVQHYHSRSKRRLTSISRSSSEDTSSEEGCVIVPEKRRVSFGQTKYKRINTKDNHFQTTAVNHVEVCSLRKNCRIHHYVPKSYPTESLETNL